MDGVVGTMLTNVAAPLGIAGVLAFVGLRFGSGAVVRYAISAAVAAGVIVGYAALPDWAGWRAERFWQWLPYLAAALGLLSPIALAEGVRWWERLTFYAAGSLLAAILLVPQWPDLAPTPTVLIAASTLGMLGCALCFDALAPRLPVAEPLVAGGTMLAMAVASAATFSMKYGQLALLPASAMLGVWLACWLNRASANTVMGLRSAALPQALFLFAAIWPSTIEPSPAKWELLLLTLTPLCCWPAIAIWRSADKATVRSLAAVAMCVVYAAATTTYLLRDYLFGAAEEW